MGVLPAVIVRWMFLLIHAEHQVIADSIRGRQVRDFQDGSIETKVRGTYQAYIYRRIGLAERFEIFSSSPLYTVFHSPVHKKHAK